MPPWQSSAVSPALLTSLIKKAWSIQALLETYAAHQSELNHIHLSACWNKLGHLARAAGQSWFKDHAKGLEAMVQHTLRVVSNEAVQARQLVNIAHGIAHSGRGPAMSQLMKALARSIQRRLGDCNAQELANTAWAFAKAGQSDAELFEALARVAEKRISELNAQEVANTVWAFATTGHVDTKLFAAAARVVEQRLGDFTVQGLANTAWAFAKAGHTDTKLFTAMARSAEQRADYFFPQDLAQAAWAFAKAGHADTQLFAALARSAEWHLASFNAQGLATTVWAFAKAGHLDGKLFTALARSIEKRLSDFNAQDLANATWAFAKACHFDAQLFAALAGSAERRLGDFNAQDLVNTAWGFSKVGHSEPQLFSAIAKALAQCVGQLNAQHLANVAWAFAKAEQLDAELFKALAQSAESRIGDFSPSDLASTAWAFANAGHVDARLFGALAKSVETCMDALNDEELENTAWAFGKAGKQQLAKRLRQRKEKDTQVPKQLSPVDVSKCGRIVVAGGGIGGAAIAVALQSRGFEVVVLEADAKFDSRKQGYGLTIQRVDAIQALGISLEQEDASATSHYIFSSTGQILGVYGEAFRQKSQRIEKRGQTANAAGRFLHIPRQTLRAKLVDQVLPGTIKWGSKLKKFAYNDGAKGARRRTSSQGQDDDEKQTPGRGVTVTLSDGTTIEASLLVGADGIFSSVRRQMALPGDRLNYLGLIVVLGMVPTNGLNACGKKNGSHDKKAVASNLAQGRIFETVDGVARIYAMPFTSTVTMWQLSFPYAEEAARALVKDPAALKEEILRLCGDWHEPIPSLLQSTPLECMSGYPVYDRDPLDAEVLHTAAAGATAPEPKLQRRVTIIGDAAHPMCPFRAQGANQALSDAVLLAETLEDSVRQHGPQDGLGKALPVFEQKMLSRAARVVIASREKARELHSSLAMKPARKVQRESGVDMSAIIRTLRTKGIGAQSAVDPRGLDALVAEVIDIGASGLCESSALYESSAGAEGGKKKKRKGSDVEVAQPPAGEEAENGASSKRQKTGVEKNGKTARKKAAAAAGEAQLDADWWRSVVFEGYTGEQWEDWYKQKRG
eukprot:TRINITY_DN24481_c0_g2_i3.p1 TRINITY_DN24481_c0_g2~~TRINITY_DN24481_c0_g2_i3.p1  ORF type:complete len:1080 (-),score=278.32 TRINITY_DN24481_c0_g2_i3:174-3413(-)